MDNGWTAFYCAPQRQVIVLAGPADHHWEEVALDVERSSEHVKVWTSAPVEGEFRDIAFILELDDDGQPYEFPIGFDQNLLGSMTLWPHPTGAYLWWTPPGARRPLTSPRHFASGELGRAPAFDVSDRFANRQSPVRIVAPTGETSAAREPTWKHDDEAVGGVVAEVARSDSTPADFDHAVALHHGEGESLYQLDRPSVAEWLLITSSGGALGQLPEADRGNLTAFGLWRFQSADDRRRWLDGRGWLPSPDEQLSRDRSIATEALVNTIEELATLFPTGALAYLVASRKAEGPISDAIAAAMHTKLRREGLDVVREWTDRRDLAVVRDGSVVIEAEAKALYSLDVLTPRLRAQYLNGKGYHGGDVAKLAPAINAGRHCYLLSLVTHFDDVIPVETVGLVKYARMHNAVARRFPSGAAMMKASSAWREDLQEWGDIQHEARLDLGSVWNIGVRLKAYLVGPLDNVALKKLAGLGLGEPKIR
jgi:hypothetical protein